MDQIYIKWTSTFNFQKDFLHWRHCTKCTWKKKWTYKHALIIVHLLSNCCCASPAFFLLPTRSRFNNGNQFPVVSLVTFMTSNQVSRQLTKQKLGSTRWLNLYNSVFTQSDAAAIFEKQGESKSNVIMRKARKVERLLRYFLLFVEKWQM